jgi:RNase H-like domain found in reverse transcriptase
VHSTLGVLGYQRPFIPGFAKIARPLTDLLKTKTGPKNFKWTEECMKVVDKLISIVTSDPVLHQLNYDKPFILEVNASQFAIRAILQQEGDDGKLHPVGYYSKALMDVEHGYNIHDRELMAIVKGLEHWQHLLAASGHTMTVYTDHQNLLYYRKPQDINWRVARYIPHLAEYNFKLVHKPGATN